MSGFPPVHLRISPESGISPKSPESGQTGANRPNPDIPPTTGRGGSIVQTGVYRLKLDISPTLRGIGSAPIECAEVAGHETAISLRSVVKFVSDLPGSSKMSRFPTAGIPTLAYTRYTE
jgi:hypothetical protein